ncbi:hypothetical protein CKO35_09790 [Ectothiorhodospira shaposhnikovii]|nr:hypothetical protein [Ectothiorhodospira shaposhnikovii]
MMRKTIMWFSGFGRCLTWRSSFSMSKTPFGVLLILSVLGSPAMGSDPINPCPGVSIEAISHLDMGLLRTARGARGWAVLQGDRTLITSDDISISSSISPMPGMFRITAPPGRELTLVLEVIQDWPNPDQVRLIQPLLSERGRALPRDSERWRLVTANTDMQFVEHLVELGLELQIRAVSGPEQFHTRIRMTCTGSRLLY